MRLKLASQANTGRLTAALPGHEHEGLQQSQYLVDCPDPEAACAAKGNAAASETRRSEAECIFAGRRGRTSRSQLCSLDEVQTTIVVDEWSGCHLQILLRAGPGDGTSSRAMRLAWGAGLLV